jgi:aminoglycoside phosphotransferase family enzyme/predicted kinase
MTIPAAQQDTAALLRGLAGRDPLETHISAVFVGTDTVWKLKKAVRLSFLDFTRLADRHRFLLRELELNAPAAPGMYRDVAAIVRGPQGALTLTDKQAPDADVAEWVLRMARVPEADFLDAVAAAGGLTPALLDAVADAVAAYHRGLPPVTGIDAPDAMRRVARGNLRAALDAGLPEAPVRAWLAAIEPAIDRLAPWLAQRAADGFVRRAHGDLHLGNLCLWQGRPVPFDAIEFDEAMATIDLGYDLGFLLMDLDHRVGRAAANRVLNRYVARTGDAALTRGLPVFLSLRAMIRAQVEASRGNRAVAARYLAAAESYLAPLPPMVIAVGGIPATGKSTLARLLAPRLGAAPGALVLRSDEIRKRRHGVAPEERLAPEAYTEAESAAVFGELTATAGAVAAGGHAVIADGMFLRPAQRESVRQAADAAGVPFLGLWLTAPLAELERRIVARRDDASDATLAVLRRYADADPGPLDWMRIDASSADAALSRIVETVQSRFGSHIRREPC